MAEWPPWLIEEQIGTRRRLAVAAAGLLIITTLNSLCSWGRTFEPVASVCPSQDRHEPWLLERPRRVRRPTANCVLVLAPP